LKSSGLTAADLSLPIGLADGFFPISLDLNSRNHVLRTGTTLTETKLNFAKGAQVVARHPKTIDEYLAGVSDDQRAALEKLRKTIRAAAPQAEECINYGIPAFRLNGECVAGFGASTKHCSYYPMSGKTVATLQDDLKDCKTSKGSIQFSTDKPLPAALVRKLIKTRIAEARR
jgi:uncharacterized protein YdhG (YjbR/CyaY superfamily)